MDGLLFEIGSSIKIRDRRIFQIPFQSKYIDSEVFWINFEQLFLLMIAWLDCVLINQVARVNV